MSLCSGAEKQSGNKNFQEADCPMTSPFSEHEFHSQMSRALETVRTVLGLFVLLIVIHRLDINKGLRLPGEINHHYEDKFLLAELLGNCTVAAHINCLEYFGLTKENLEKLKGWSKTRSVSLRLKAEGPSIPFVF